MSVTELPGDTAPTSTFGPFAWAVEGLMVLIVVLGAWTAIVVEPLAWISVAVVLGLLAIWVWATAGL